MYLKEPKYSITIAISTVGKRLNDALNMAKNLDKSEDVEILIIHQTSKEACFEKIKLKTKARYLSSNKVGAAASRNIALSEAHGEYIWFMDDDILLADNAVSIIRTIIKNQNFDLAIVGILCTNDFLPFIINTDKIDNLVGSMDYYQISKVGTPQIIVRSDFGRKAIFPENYGAGTSQGIGDEPIYLSRLLKNECKAIQIKANFMKHPMVSSGDVHKYKIKLRLKLYFKIYGLRGFIIFLFKRIF